MKDIGAETPWKNRGWFGLGRMLDGSKKMRLTESLIAV
jgi:hypothetical protein